MTNANPQHTDRPPIGPDARRLVELSPSLFLSRTQLAKRLNLSTKTIQRMVNAGKIPPPLPWRGNGTAKTFSVATLAAWIDQGMPPVADFKTPGSDEQEAA